VWTNYYGGPGGFDYPFALVADSNGNVFVGHRRGTEPNYDNLTIKYSEHGRAAVDQFHQRGPWRWTAGDDNVFVVPAPPSAAAVTWTGLIVKVFGCRGGVMDQSLRRHGPHQ